MNQAQEIFVKILVFIIVLFLLIIEILVIDIRIIQIVVTVVALILILVIIVVEMRRDTSAVEPPASMDPLPQSKRPDDEDAN